MNGSNSDYTRVGVNIPNNLTKIQYNEREPNNMNMNYKDAYDNLFSSISTFTITTKKRNHRSSRYHLLFCKGSLLSCPKE